MGAAPDLDWLLDFLPVDFAAEAITRLVFNGNLEPFRVFHLANPKLRHWRELILWINLFGYGVELLPYQDWLHRLNADVRKDRKSTRLNSSHRTISYAVFCLKKKI